MQFNYQSHSKQSGVYLIYNHQSHGIYIGECKEFKNRWTQGYQKSLIKGKCHNKHLQNSYKKHFEELGHDSFISFYILKVMENSTKEERTLEETKFIHFYKELGCNLYNMIEETVRNENACWSHTPEETKAKLSDAAKGQHRSPTTQFKPGFIPWNKGIKWEARSGENHPMYGKIGELNPSYGRHHTEETIEKLTQSIKESYKTEAGQTRKEKMSKARLGKSFEKLYGEEKTKEIKNKLSINGKTNPNCIISRFQKGHQFALETKQKISKSKKGKYLGMTSPRAKIYDLSSNPLISPTGEQITEIKCINEFCRKYNLENKNLHAVLKGKRKSHKGWFLKFMISI